MSLFHRPSIFGTRGLPRGDMSAGESPSSCGLPEQKLPSEKHDRLMTKRLVRISGAGMAEHPFLVSARYHALRYLGEGSYGVVARARDSADNDREVAIKRVHQAFNNVTDARHLLREVRLLRALSHPNLLPLIDVDLPHSYLGWTDVYLVSPLKPHTLSKRLDQYKVKHPRIPLPDDVARKVLTGVLRALKYMHSANVIHRDLKPANILLDEDWAPYICDMGLARSIDPEHEGNLSVNVATKPYRAPELFITPDEYSSPLDMWSVGCMIHELLAPGAKPLFSRNHRLQLEAILSVIGSPTDADLRTSFDPAGRWHISKLRSHRNRQPLPLEKRFGGEVPISSMNSLLIDLMSKLLVFNPKSRLTADQALRHPFFSSASEPALDVLTGDGRAAEIAALEPEPRNRTSFTKEDLRRQLWDEVCLWHPEEAEEVRASGCGPD